MSQRILREPSGRHAAVGVVLVCLIAGHAAGRRRYGNRLSRRGYVDYELLQHALAQFRDARSPRALTVPTHAHQFSSPWPRRGWVGNLSSMNARCR
jgi:hypothetical protein